jgi:hypothetical protein
MCLAADRGLGISTYSQHDLAAVFVQLHVSVSFDDIFESERLRDLRVEISVFHALIPIALRSCESFGVFDDLPEPIPANGQRLLDGTNSPFLSWPSSIKAPYAVKYCIQIEVASVGSRCSGYSANA